MANISEIETQSLSQIVVESISSGLIKKPEEVVKLSQDLFCVFEGKPVEDEPEYIPAVDPGASITSKRLISLIDGKPYKMLKRHLKSHGMTPDQYRERYGLNSDYPMVAAEYSKVRSRVAKEKGLGRKAA